MVESVGRLVSKPINPPPSQLTHSQDRQAALRDAPTPSGTTTTVRRRATYPSFNCPHCNQAVGTTPDYMAVSAPAPRGWAVYVLACPHCNTALGVYSTQPHTGLLPPTDRWATPKVGSSAAGCTPWNLGNAYAWAEQSGWLLGLAL